ncbi:MAG: DNA-3-methyladenine glycosylase [Terriglobia bacterium]|jgi:DNA-3-methyladenine glycosylase|nr:DNA-3-methyladenine glycosylase [Terriglobia bacterium]
MHKHTPNGAPDSALKRARPLLPRFFDRDPRKVAQELLGKLLIRNENGHLLAGRVVETEAYMGVTDAAAHSAAGLTKRNAVLFGPPGHAYVYFIYGNHYCLNVSCMPEGDAGCVLFRAMEPVAGLPRMARYRNLELPPEPRVTQLRVLTSGPGRMAEALDITRDRDNGKDLTDPSRSDLWLADDSFRPESVTITPRIGITKAIDEPLRFVISGNPFVSGRRV